MNESHPHVSAATEYATCKYCGTTSTPNDEPPCSTLEQAYEQTPTRPYGCPWFDRDSRKMYPKGRAEMSNLKDPERALVERCRADGFDITAGCNLVDLVRRAGLTLTFNAAQPMCKPAYADEAFEYDAQTGSYHRIPASQPSPAATVETVETISKTDAGELLNTIAAQADMIAKLAAMIKGLGAQPHSSAGSDDDLREEVSYAIYSMKTTDGATDAIMKLIADRPQRERMWCRSCGTVTTSGNCDCTETGTGTQNLVNYADGLAEDARELAQEIARLRAVPQTAAWRLIGTAPKDGSKVDLWHPEKGRIPDATWNSNEYAPSMPWGWGSLIWGRIRGATHWMPAPAGPSLTRPQSGSGK